MYNYTRWKRYLGTGVKMFKGILGVCGILLAGVSASDDKCSNAEVIVHAQKCLDLHHVPLTLPESMSSSASPLSLFTFTFQINDTAKNVICRREHRENYTKASICMFSKMRECARRRHPLILYLIPTTDNVRRLTQQMCEGSQEYNQTCAVSTFNTMQVCVVTLANERSVDFNELSCAIIEIIRECTRQELKSCGVATAHMYETNLPVLARCISTTAIMAYCTTSERFISERQKCLDAHDVIIDLPDPEVLSKSSQAILTMMSQTGGRNTRTVCSSEHRDNYIQASICVYSLMKTCAARGSTIFQILVPTPDNVHRLIEQECLGFGEYNQACAIGKLENIEDCVNATYRDRGSNSTEDDEDLCLSIEITRECTRQQLQACGKPTVLMYEENLPISESCKSNNDTNSVPASGHQERVLGGTLIGVVVATVVCVVLIIVIAVVAVILRKRRKKGYFRAARQPQPGEST